MIRRRNNVKAVFFRMIPHRQPYDNLLLHMRQKVVGSSRRLGLPVFLVLGRLMPNDPRRVKLTRLQSLLPGLTSWIRHPVLFGYVHGKGVHSSTRKPALSRRYATVCPHGLAAGSLTAVAPASTARAYNAGTSGVTKAISTPSGALSGEADTTYCFKCVLINSRLANASRVAPVSNSP